MFSIPDFLVKIFAGNNFYSYLCTNFWYYETYIDYHHESIIFFRTTRRRFSVGGCVNICQTVAARQHLFAGCAHGERVCRGASERERLHRCNANELLGESRETTPQRQDHCPLLSQRQTQQKSRWAARQRRLPRGGTKHRFSWLAELRHAHRMIFYWTISIWQLTEDTQKTIFQWPTKNT